ncbi:GNAT family N-acetyltransferase [Alteribacter keqinensis]|uniref:GNAT family N-acetyltransferase n=1 Tax=Alteribacter keqinensis TaxID=2483800 RepID=A0A3M7TUX2_9BACI|nr:GNAT family N-acetyltransferase [Alteribacter keqinensis]RNA69440.1 GNAT family N-acetyltransferase [Alteribacter keqinensis]
MKKTEEQIVLCEYEPGHAEAVAKMWNLSREGWGGHSDVKTGTNVRDQQANSANLHTFLAMDNNEVIGYCGLSEYREDEGALYIPLLNVRTDYHGRKIGKKLILTALEETIRREWPRLDLYTWPGNTKAVPLYKKCGFFWENRDDTVHLMNFLPTVMTQELFKPLFEHLDWYKDSVREIKTEPDGNKTNGFDCYTYEWKKDSRNLRVEFEKTGRGISSFRTEDYAVTMTIPHHTCISGREYEASFTVKNTSDQTIAFSFSGRDNKNIRFSGKREMILSPGEKKVLAGTFAVLEQTGDQKSMQTHPAVEAAVVIDGRTVTMKTGVLTKAPVTLSGALPGNQSFLHQKETAYLQVENNSSTQVDVVFELPSNDNVVFAECSFSLSLDKKEKRVVPVPYELGNPLFYSEDVTVKANLDDTEIMFQQTVTFPFNVQGRGVFGECSAYIHLFQGLSHVALKKENNALIAERGRANKGSYTFMYPKIGLPFSEEFSKMEPESVSFFEEESGIGVELSYLSRNFPGLVVKRVVKLAADGMMTQSFGLQNSSDQPVGDLHLNEPLMFDLSETTLPYDGEIVFNRGTYSSEVSVWESEKLTGNWLFSRNQTWPAALVWSSGVKLHFHTWHMMYFEHVVKTINSGETVFTPPVTFSIGALHSADEVKSFAEKKAAVSPSVLSDVMKWGTKDGNPFVSNTAVLAFAQRVNRSTEGDFRITLPNEEEAAKGSWSSEDGGGKWEATLPVTTSEQAVLATIQGQLSGYHFKKTTALLPPGNHRTAVEESKEKGKQVFTVDNGVLSIKAAPDFYPGIYSLSYEGEEWLASSFPEPEPKSWWNPWIGGIRLELFGLSARSILKEKTNASFVSVEDEYKNEWNGVELTFSISDHPVFGGVTVRQYALMLPGVPVLCSMYEIKQETAVLWNNQTIATGFNLHTGEETGSVVVQAGDDSEAYRHHHHEHHLSQFSHLTASKSGRNEKLHIFPEQTNDKMELYMNQHVVVGDSRRTIALRDKETFFSEPMFFMFSDEEVPLEATHDLRSVRFDHTTWRKG